MKSKRFNLIVNLIGLAMVIFMVVMLFVPYFTFDHVVTAKPPKMSGLIGGELTKTLDELGDRLEDDQCSIAHYAFVPTDRLGNGISGWVKEKFPELTITDGSFAIPVAALMLGGLAVIILTAVKIYKKVPSVFFLVYGIIGVWAFLSMPPFRLNETLGGIMFAVSLVLALGGLAYTVLYLYEKSGEVFNIVANLLCAVLLIALIFVLFPSTQSGTAVAFDIRDAGTAPETNPYLIKPVKDFFGTYTYASPILLLAVAALVAVISILRCGNEWPMFLQFFAGVIGMFIILTNPVFKGNIPATSGGLAASMFVLAVALVRLAIFSIDRAPRNVATYNYLNCFIFLIVIVLMFVSTWTIDNPASAADKAHMSLFEASMSAANIEKGETSPAKKAKNLQSRLNKELEANGQYLADEFDEFKPEFDVEGAPVEKAAYKFDVRSVAWVGQVTLIIALLGLMVNIILKEKFLSGIANILLGFGGAIVFLKVKELHFSTNYLVLLFLFAAVILTGAIILVATLLGHKPAAVNEEECELPADAVPAVK